MKNYISIFLLICSVILIYLGMRTYIGAAEFLTGNNEFLLEVAVQVRGLGTLFRGAALILFAAYLLHLSSHYAEYNQIPQIVVGLFMFYKAYEYLTGIDVVTGNLFQMDLELAIPDSLTYMIITIKGLSYSVVAVVGIILPAKSYVDKKYLSEN